MVKKKAVLITGKNFNKIRNQVKKTLEGDKKSIFIFSSYDDELNRKVIEKIQRTNILMIPLSERKDFMKQKNSGFNHVMAREAKKNNVSIGISLEELINSDNKTKAKLISRISQNIMLCNKYKIQMFFIYEKDKNKRNVRDLKSFGLVLGMPTWMTKNLKQIKAE